MHSVEAYFPEGRQHIIKDSMHSQSSSSKSSSVSCNWQDPSQYPACLSHGVTLQNKDRPGYLRNDGNDFLSYTDDWYILGWKPDVYAVIYYKGNNDAWKGYGGATVYTR